MSGYDKQKERNSLRNLETRNCKSTNVLKHNICTMKILLSIHSIAFGASVFYIVYLDSIDSSCAWKCEKDYPILILALEILSLRLKEWP